VLEVDEFVDEVEAAFEQLTDENANLRKQIESLKSGGAAPASAPTDAAANAAESRPAVVSPAPVAEHQPIVVTTSKEASQAVTRLVELSTEHAETLVNEATAEAERIREEANRSAHQVTTEARTQAERIASEAQVEADRVQGDATSRAEQMDREIEARRRELFGDLDKQREDLVVVVDQLRTFEAAYRENLATELRERLDSLTGTSAEPADVPEAANAPVRRSGNDEPANAAHGESDDDPPTLGGGSTSNTPRLDALLGEQP
jgi:cell division septum initiation protein DivIVA